MKIFTPSRLATSCSLQTKTIIHTPTSVRSFPREDERDFDYTYKAGPKKKVVLMGTKAFGDFLISIQGHLGTLNSTVEAWENQVTVLTASLENGSPNAQQEARALVKIQGELSDTRTAIDEPKKFYVKMKKQWTKPKDRVIVIGHVVWAPPVSFLLEVQSSTLISQG
jgi:hypothetical protein